MIWYTVGEKQGKVMHNEERFLYIRGDVFQLEHLTKKTAKPFIDGGIVEVVKVEEVNGRFKLKRPTGQRIYSPSRYDQVAVMLDGKLVTRDCVWADTDKGEVMLIQRLENLLPKQEYAMVGGRSTAVPLCEVQKGAVTVFKIATATKAE